MSNESKNNAEAMLKAYAERRRAEAGPPIEPHPVTRKLLQDEIARTFPAGEKAAPSWWRLFAEMFPRLAVAGSIFAALVLTVYLVHRDRPGALTMAMNGTSSASKPAGAPDTTRNLDGMVQDEKLKSLKPGSPPILDAEAKRAGAGVEPPATLGGALKDGPTADDLARRKLTLAGNEADRAKVGSTGFGTAGNLGSEVKKAQPSEPAAPDQSPLLSKAESGPAPKPVAEEKQAGLKTKDAATSTAIAATTTTATSPSSLSVTPATGGMPARPAAQKAAEDKAAADGGGVSLASKAKNVAKESEAVIAGAAAAAPPVSQSFYFREATGELRQNFSQANQRAQYRQNFNSPKPSPVLNNFQLERAGNRIQVTDADGSIYVGTVVLGDAEQSKLQAVAPVTRSFDSLAPAAKPVGNNQAQAAPAARSARKDAVAESQNIMPDSSQANFAFQVAGTNRTVKKVVIFNGTLNIDPAVSGAGQQLPQSGVGGQALQSSPALPNAMQNSQNRVITNQAGLIQNGRVSGQATVGGREKLPIDAVPAAP